MLCPLTMCHSAAQEWPGWPPVPRVDEAGPLPHHLPLEWGQQGPTLPTARAEEAGDSPLPRGGLGLAQLFHNLGREEKPPTLDVKPAS